MAKQTAFIFVIAVAASCFGLYGAIGDQFECVSDGGSSNQGIGIIHGSPILECPRGAAQLNQLLTDCAGGLPAGPPLSCAVLRGSFGPAASMLNVSCLTTTSKVQQLNEVIVAFGNNPAGGLTLYVLPALHVCFSFLQCREANWIRRIAVLSSDQPGTVHPNTHVPHPLSGCQAL